MIQDPPAQNEDGALGRSCGVNKANSWAVRPVAWRQFMYENEVLLAQSGIK